ncbi:DUF2218 domain-containing protein [Paralimibaculum aggregatum]|uniref:DUF2218 domain-containing protein n=1 Tax=Paralimibaculum aggregatum TaxID=3036245 RepID=A0ABQ6LGI7_9RHOB|nr:DUF2218 domain-containing protein [Limibaculum sp. NKW23]GMG82429.1 DUF2218 domain-containing protein [Limibaculum sp. NKW23]
MLKASARFETENASRYLQQLCKHFAHKVPVDYDATRARAELPPGPARMAADATGLDIEVTAAEAESLTRAKFIIEDHLKRFAHREAPADLVWS